MVKRISVALLVAAGLLLASGGSGGGGGTGGGGTGGGGSSSCSYISSFSAKGTRSPYGSTLADIQVSYTLTACNAGFVPSTTITVTRLDNGVMAWSNTYGGMTVTTGHYGWLPVNTTYTVEIKVTDASTGTILETRSTTATTPAGKTT